MSQDREYWEKILTDVIQIANKNFTNRVPTKIGIYCRWLRVPKGEEYPFCDGGEGICTLEKCVECFCLSFGDSSNYYENIRKYEEMKKKNPEKFEGKYNIYQATLDRFKNEMNAYRIKIIKNFLEEITYKPILDYLILNNIKLREV